MKARGHSELVDYKSYRPLIVEDIMGCWVKVHWNFTLKCWSVSGKDGLLGHTNMITLECVELKVQPGGRERAIREDCKNVHAYVAGHVRPTVLLGNAESVRYSYKDGESVGAFRLADKTPVTAARLAQAGYDGLYVVR